MDAFDCNSICLHDLYMMILIYVYDIAFECMCHDGVYSCLMCVCDTYVYDKFYDENYVMMLYDYVYVMMHFSMMMKYMDKCLYDVMLMIMQCVI